MALFSPAERRFLNATASLGYSNPFLPERIEWERAALGREYLENEPVWSVSVADPEADLPNILRIYEKLGGLIESLHGRLAAVRDLQPEDLAAYEDSVHSLLYQRYYSELSPGRRCRRERPLAVLQTVPGRLESLSGFAG